MRIGCLQFSPSVGNVDDNLTRADQVLSAANPEDLDILVLPELAFSGYNFKSLREIHPFLEPTGSGISSVWARTTALRYNCAVAVGYPEKADVSHKWPCSPEYYNSLIVVNQDGDAWAHYRKSHLYYTDESWALEGPDGFWKGYLPGVGKLALGICMDINPYRFESPWERFEFATHALKVSADVVIVSMAWLTHENTHQFTSQPREPDMETLTYWVKRMDPLIREEGQDEIIVIFANRSGSEDEVLYAGTSAVLGIQNGEVTVYGLLGRGENALLVVDTDQTGFAKLVYRPEDQNSVEATDLPHDAETEASNGQVLSETLYPESSDEPGGQADGHLFLQSDGTAQQREGVVLSASDESPISHRHFNDLLAQENPRSHRFSLFGENNTYEQWRALLSGDGDVPSGSTVSQDPTDLNSESATEFSTHGSAFDFDKADVEVAVERTLFERLRHARPDDITRTTGRLDQWAKTTPTATEPLGSGHHLGKSHPISLPDPPVSRTPGGEQRKPGARATTISHHLGNRLANLDISGTDLAVFEEGETRRAKRDSLVCHVDEDDYIVLQTARKDGNSGRSKPSRSHSRTKGPTLGQTHRQLSHDRSETSNSGIPKTKLRGGAGHEDESCTTQPLSSSREEQSSRYKAAISTSKSNSKSSWNGQGITSPVLGSSSHGTLHESRPEAFRGPQKADDVKNIVIPRDRKYPRDNPRASVHTEKGPLEGVILFPPNVVEPGSSHYISLESDAETFEAEVPIQELCLAPISTTPIAMILGSDITGKPRTGPTTTTMTTPGNSDVRVKLDSLTDIAEFHRGRPRSVVW
ncbi:hypothetical protein JX265_011815 [Neoarthrinium moseri]|uniref:CN hydrolase domain-containing protein n=1 Tax=Neoarthrinium moseri TaxID=1658444 RepID=A0A9P9WBJ8_9PEZI|nr:hypothetical protein JX265_011815 [Neoarthrinium moseri]